jgi:transcriptional regulator GlxA family with amidase domain
VHRVSTSVFKTTATRAGSAAPKPDRRKVIGILGFDGVTALDLTGPLEAFAMARTSDGSGESACYKVVIIGLNGRTFVSDSGVVIKAHATTEAATDYDTLIIPGGSGLRTKETLRHVSDWVASQAAHTRRIAAISTGTYALAQTGLLKGRRVTSHWRFAPELARRFPQVQVDQSASFVKDGPFYTCGGGTAAIEMTLSLVEEDYGTRLALTIARELVMRLRPPGQHASSIDPSQFQVGPADRLMELPTWIASHLDDDLSVEALSERAYVCPRHFSRLFKRIFKTTPADFVEHLRLREARQRLLTSRATIDSVAGAVGFKSGDSFRRAFERRYGITPSQFRATTANAVAAVDRRESQTGASLQHLGMAIAGHGR